MASVHLRRNHLSTLASVLLGLGLALTALVLFGPGVWTAGGLAQAAGQVRYVAPGGSDSSNLCLDSQNPCATVQHAVDVAASGDEIRLAGGRYTGVSFRDGYTQVVYINKSLTVKGGYNPPNWSSPKPDSNPSTLDAQRQGQVMVITGTNEVTVEGLRFTQSTLRSVYPSAVILVSTATVTLRNNIIFDNEGVGAGFGKSRAILNGNSIYSNTGEGILLAESETTLIDNLISNNGLGIGSVYKDQVILINNTISENKGQGLFLFMADTVRLSDNLIDNNLCSNSNRADCFGGGVYIAGCEDVTLNDNVISRNSVEVDQESEFEACGGGVALVASTAQLSNNTIISNTSNEEGGGLCLAYDTHATLTNNLIAGNRAEYSGGGLFVTFFGDSLVTLTDDTIANNTAKIGGGMTMGSGNRVRLSGSVLRNNNANIGGGISLIESEAALTNTVIADNQAGTLGSGLFIEDSSTSLLHTTIARNGGDAGSGLHIAATSSYPPFSRSVTLTNTILVSHTVGITGTVNSMTTLNGVLWFNNGANTGGAGTITITNAYTGDPAFLPLKPGNYHLSPASAALDRAIDAGVTTDIDGDPRPYGAGYDLGADEGQPGLRVTKAASTDLAQPGAVLTYTLRVTNTGYVSLTTAITDILPEQVIPTGVLTWTPFIPLGGTWEEQVTVAVETGYVGPVVNVIQVTSAEGASGSYTQSVMAGRIYYLPVIAKGG